MVNHTVGANLRDDSPQRGRVVSGVRAPGQEFNDMKHFLIFGGLLMAASVVAPVAMMADDHHGEKRYYDRVHRDYHYWNDGEDRQYRAYLVERHEAYVPFVHYRHRPEYFRYRHEHGFEIGIR
jgi:hypothetical protein